MSDSMTPRYDRKRRRRLARVLSSWNAANRPELLPADATLPGNVWPDTPPKPPRSPRKSRLGLARTVPAS